jgi:hypothetical protein
MSYNEALTPRRAIWPEVFRILVLVAAAIGVTSPFLTSHTVGGVDARWYAYMMRGFTDQIGGGHFPAPVGEGAFAWNGGVHPFRSAPLLLILGGIWKVLSLGRLGTFTLMHVVLVTSAVAGTVGFYAASVKIMPSQRWAAAGVSFLYLCAPSWLAVVFKADAYMSYVAFAAMPLVLYGNALTVLKPDGRGFVALGAGLALIWMCHPPIAFLTTMATLFIQTGRAVALGLGSWRKMLAGVAVFGALATYYFTSMSEVPAFHQDHPMGQEVLQIAALALFFVALARSAFRPFNFLWPLAAVAAAIVVGRLNVPWIYWMVFSAAFWIPVAIAARFTTRVDLGRHGASLLFICAVAGAAASEGALGFGDNRLFRGALALLAENTAVVPGLLRPLSKSLVGVAMFQIGWGLDLALAAGCLSLFSRRSAGSKVFFAAPVALAICFVRIPLASNFLVGHFPIGLSAMCGLPLCLRITPVIAGFTAMSGVVWLASIPAPSVHTRRIAGVLLAACVAWAAVQSLIFVREGHAITGGDSITERNLRPENMILERFAYDLLRLPDYFTGGVTDPSIESRIIDDRGDVVVGMAEEARAAESRGARKVRLVCGPLDNAPNWLNIIPKIPIEPGEHLLLRFEFDPSKTYNGYLLFVSEHCYRDYHLPAAGQSAGFGTGATNSKVLSIWNSGPTRETYSLSVSREPGNNISVSGGVFADVTISHLDPDVLPIRLESIDPYRVSFSTPSGGWLETFRCYLPGYRAYVDGAEVPYSRSRQALVEVKVPPGEHNVVLRFVGTVRLWAAACVSAAGWILLVFLACWNRRGFREEDHA